jgi:hypothetical protein
MSTTGPISVPSTVTSVSTPAPFEYGEDYAFYDARSGLLPDYYQKLLATATTSIQIWDTHTRIDDWKVFTSIRKTGLRITLMTICDKDFKTEQDVKDLANGIKNNMDAAVTSFNLKIFAFHDKYRYSQKLWHDRFLVIDDRDYYLVGPSLNNQYGSSSSFGIHFLSKAKDIKVLENKLKSYMTLASNATLRHRVSRNRP